MKEPFSTLSDAEALKIAGYGRTVLLEVIATSPGYFLVRTHYINTEGESPFQQKEPLIEIALDFLADKMGHVMLMVACLNAQLRIHINATDLQTYEILSGALTDLMKVFASEYNVDIQEIQKHLQEQPIQNQQIEASGKKMIVLKDPEDIKKFLSMLGRGFQKGGCSCGHPDCTGKR